MRRLLLLFVMISGFSVSTSHVAKANVLTLEHLEAQALKKHPLLDADDARVRGAEADLRKASSAYYPQVGLRGESSLAPGRQLVTIPSSDGKTEYLVSGAPKVGEDAAFAPQVRHGLDVTATANLYDFGRTKAAVRAGRVAAEAAGSGSAVTREGIVRALREAYVAWLSAHQQTQFAMLGRDDANKRLDRVRALVAEGTRPKSDVAPAETERLLAELELTRAQGALAEARLTLEHASSVAIPESAEPDLSLLARELPASGRTPDAQQRSLALQRDAAYATERAAKAQLRPVVGVAASAGVRMQRTDEGDFAAFPLYAVGMNLTVPLWDGGTASATGASSRARGDELDARLRDRAREQELALDRTRLTVEQARQQLVVAEALRDQCEQRLLQAEDGYKIGALGIEQIYQARAMLRRAESELLFARVGRAQAILRVMPVNGEE